MVKTVKTLPTFDSAEVNSFEDIWGSFYTRAARTATPGTPREIIKPKSAMSWRLKKLKAQFDHTIANDPQMEL